MQELRPFKVRVRTDLTVKKTPGPVGMNAPCYACVHSTIGPYPRRNCARGHYIDATFRRWDIDRQVTIGWDCEDLRTNLY